MLSTDYRSAEMGHGRRRRLLLAFSTLLLGACGGGREHMDAAFLLGDDEMDAPVPTAAFAPGEDVPPKHYFEGRLVFRDDEGAGGQAVHVDLFDLAANTALETARLPDFDFHFIQSGTTLIPVERGPQRSAHPHWEYILEPGSVWDEPGDGDFSRAALPFSLAERNANCTHNGLLTFLYSTSGKVSRVAYQVTSETCHYLQLDLWGALPAAYRPGSIDGGAGIVGAHEAQLERRLPRRPFSALANDYPVVDPAAFLGQARDEVTTFGFVVDGVHYSGGCETRYGPHPYCEALDLPSYSLAKTLFAGVAYMWMVQRDPELASLAVTDYVPECADARTWGGVTLGHLVDMTSGVFESTEDQVDEFYSYTTDFIDADSHAGKIAAACTLFERQAEPGETFVYHSTETYIAGTLMNAYLEDLDIHADVLVNGFMRPLGMSPVAQSTRRTYDAVAQPYTGYGLTVLADDIARFALFLMESGGVVDGAQRLSRRELNAALQRDPLDRGAVAGPKLRYNNGLWALNVQEFIDCEAPTWVPFMSGYGGITVALLPNGTVYYVFSDGGHFAWAGAAAESNKINNYCGQS